MDQDGIACPVCRPVGLEHVMVDRHVPGLEHDPALGHLRGHRVPHSRLPRRIVVKSPTLR